ncbi:MAG: hypothetical protein JWP91_856 [Fibrobacteres bacterium]|nr:hypothetical protein [Fibrobacterota bacterium]
MEIDEYKSMLQRQDFQSLKGILLSIDAEKFQERYKAVLEEVEERKALVNVQETGRLTDSVPRWKVQKGWHKINAIIVLVLSAVSFYSTFSATESGYVLKFDELYFGVMGLIGVIFYFRKFKIGHNLLLLWWLPQLAEFETSTFKYSLYSGIKFGVDLQIGTLELSTNLLAIISFMWLIAFKKYYEKRIRKEKDGYVVLT